ncbi:hypothetical protein VC83_04678 [Pseudogymnoascus destructans]|uniref:Uncharacterized protein n=1 Tax=Pseudogymnoascus destructans TaxID=655981 RepID=A0A177A5J4_9PEZI|nr:uncharacterized protein VC83_04678 [Pseudogymnoascus destructans]OAF57418.2 hypothetical protein VC83_04678 [Pseudogymnoascus destructans]
MSHDLSTTSPQFQAAIDRQEYTRILLNSYEPGATPRRILKPIETRTDQNQVLCPGVEKTIIMATLQKAGVVLTSPRDWDEWIETIKTASMKAGVWGYIDPSIEDPPTLLQPVRPIPEFVRSATQAGGGVTAQTRPGVSTRASGSQTIQPSVEGQQQLTPITYASLTEDQKEQLQNLQADFQYERKVWEKQEEAIQGLRSKIQETIKRDFLPYTVTLTSNDRRHRGSLA